MDRFGKIHSILRAVYTENEYPALSEQYQRWKREQPLRGLRVLDATPVFRNTLLKHLTLLVAGAELSVGISDVMPHDPAIVTLLRESGIPVISAEEPCKAGSVYSLRESFDLLLDCAGSFASYSPQLGIVELTRSGAEIYAESSKPVFFADGGRIKRIETCLGTGESYFRAMAKLGYTDWRDRRLVVFGSGKVGTGIIYYAHSLGAEVHVVTDLSTLTFCVRELVVSAVHYTDTSGIASVLHGAYAVVTATGIKDALESYCPKESLLNDTILLANMGVEDEYGPSIPASAVLMQKRTLNFILEEPTHLKYIDATMALHNEGALYLLQHSLGQGLINPPVELEAYILSVTRERGCIGKEELEWI